MAKKILIIDDSAVFRKVLHLQLKNAGYEVKEAIDGLDGFNKVTGEEFNLVICDVNMPNLDGLSFVQKVRSDEKARFVPIIMLTTESQEDKKRKGLEAGAKAWLVKPFSPDQLLNAISKLIV
ncbi:MAG: response regulator [Leptospiraceae bacterium]|nr:response regulator [Leptospiraceae bacterium]MCP5512099.1 response regulator [Leptospiraceae bacterium]